MQAPYPGRNYVNVYATYDDWWHYGADSGGDSSWLYDDIPGGISEDLPGGGGGADPEQKKPKRKKDIGGHFSEDQQKTVDRIVDDVRDLLKSEDCAAVLGGAGLQ